MTFQTLDGKTWRIYWKYAEILYPDSLKPNLITMKSCRRTICYIKKVDDLRNEDVKIGWADCSPTDTFVKEVGRKISLTRALEGFTEKETRQAAWDAYLGR